MKLRWKILIAAAVFLVLMAASMMVTMHVQPQNEVEAYKKSLRAKGEKLELSEVLPPPAAPEDNSADAVQDAFRTFGSSDARVPDAMKMVAPGKAMTGWNRMDARGYDFTNSWDDFAAWVEADRPSIELLHQVLDRPKLDFQLDYKKGAALPLTHLMSMKRAAQKLDAAAIYEMHDRNSSASTTNILTLLALVRKDYRDDLLISHLVRIAITSITVTPTWELLQATNVTDTQLAAMQYGWQQMNFLSDAENCFVMERIWSSMEIEKFRSSHEKFKELTASPMFTSGSPSGGGGGWPTDWESITEGPRNAMAEVMWRTSWSYSEELRGIKSDQIILETLRSMKTNRSEFYKADSDAMASRLSSLGITNVGEAFFRALKVPDFHEEFGDWGVNTVVGKTLRIETARRVVITAIALKRYQLKCGKWPQTLGELIPEFIPSVPIDPYDGKPLTYHPNIDGTFLLYSVAEDGIDGGGDPTTTVSSSSIPYWQNPKARDWVWPQPATPAEIQYFYEHPPK